MSAQLYNVAKSVPFSWTVDTIKVLLVTSAYVFDKDHDFVDDVVAGEIAVGGYTRQTLGSKTITIDNVNDRAVFDAADVAFGTLAAGATIVAAIVFKDAGGADSANPLIAYLDFTGVPTNGGAFTVVWSANGLFRNT